MKFQLRRKSSVPNITDTVAWLSQKDEFPSSRPSSPGPDGKPSSCGSSLCLIKIIQYCFIFLTIYVTCTLVKSMIVVPTFGRKVGLLPNTDLPSLEKINIKLIEKPPDDVLIDLPNFKIIHQPSSSLCKEDDTLFLVIVHSKPDHFVQRNAIRKTWGGLEKVVDPIVKSRRSSITEDHPKEWSIRTIFVLGELHSSSKIKEHEIFTKEMVANEFNIHGDLLVGNFNDHYHNLRYKHIFGLRWASENCWGSRFILKADDDAFIDMPQLHRFLFRTLGPFGNKLTDIIAGNVFPNGTEVQRDGKWAVSYEEYPWPQFPPYLGGLAYIMTPDIASNLYLAAHAKSVPQVWVDDVWVTGLLGLALELKPLYLNPRYSYDHQEMSSWLAKNHTGVPPPFTFAHLDASRHDWNYTLRSLWKKTLVAFNLTGASHETRSDSSAELPRFSFS